MFISINNVLIYNNFLLICTLQHLDGSDFQKVEGFYCMSHYKNETSLVLALSKCRLDVNCLMVSAPICKNQTSYPEYYLCGKTPELRQNDDACYYRKSGTLTIT